MIKSIFIFIIAMIVFSVIGQYFPSSFTDSLNNAMVYFLSALWNLNGFIDVAVLFECMKLLSNFFAGLGLFWIFIWILKLTGK